MYDILAEMYNVSIPWGLEFTMSLDPIILLTLSTFFVAASSLVISLISMRNSNRSVALSGFSLYYKAYCDSYDINRLASFKSWQLFKKAAAYIESKKSLEMISGTEVARTVLAAVVKHFTLSEEELYNLNCLLYRSVKLGHLCTTVVQSKDLAEGPLLFTLEHEINNPQLLEKEIKLVLKNLDIIGVPGPNWNDVRIDESLGILFNNPLLRRCLSSKENLKV